MDSTRALFDERGMQDAPMDEIARAVGINRALIYRHFDSKDDLFVLTITRYLDEITERGLARIDPDAGPEDQLRVAWESFASYGLEYPAFLDCALSLMRRPAEELQTRLTERTTVRLTASMARCLGVTIDILERGARAGTFQITDAALTANLLYTQTIGLLHSARLGMGVSSAEDGTPQLFPIERSQVLEACVRAAFAAAAVA